MSVSLLLLLKFGYDIVKRLIRDTYFRSLGILVLIMAAICGEAFCTDPWFKQ